MVPRRKSAVPHPPGTCPLGMCMGVLGGTWTPNIVWYLSGGPRRFSELKGDVRGVSSKVLTMRLRKLESEGVIYRNVMPTSPPTVEYGLSELGRELLPAITAIVNVGHRLKALQEQKRKPRASA